MSVRDRFSSDNPYVLPAILLTARTNQADLQVITRESDQLVATSAFFQGQGLTNNPSNPVSNATLVAAQTIGVAVGDGELEGPPRCPEISQWILKERNGVAVPVRVESLTLKDFLWNPVTRDFEELIRADIVENSVLYEAIAYNGAKGTASATSPLIEGTWDIKGTPLEKVKLEMHVMTVMNLEPEYSRIKSVTKKRKTGTIRHLTTAGPSHIYCCGQTAEKMIVLHNLKPES